MNDIAKLHLVATSNADALGYQAQQAVAKAMGDSTNYRLIGGHMVRLLLGIYPSSRAVVRSTLDADAAVEQVVVIAPVAQDLMGHGFMKVRSNAFTKKTADGQTLEVNLLLSRTGPKPGLRTQTVEGVGQVDTLPELDFALNNPGLLVDVTAEISTTVVIHYKIRIPSLEAAVVLKAHAWHQRRASKDLADLYSLFEIRQEHGEVSWKLDAPQLMGRRMDAARILRPLADRIIKRHPEIEMPPAVDRIRMSALIKQHIATPG
ncbi:nucleotidyl transferase AbiEii/AbiGii toxin family protein [Kocuria sp.]|uniref:nucleotidyl transferase AbiEii/AbiGii toxin family protein n=1 Tax=Kocuria sp. TaxID=1871328 RepID=UPI0026E0DA0E|nr:nucleotidyl transferase AbiEii/AbiGii toxin family protein [Kocuria sp.]MDO5619546.1 nucleotidyl transferase AbiEii/AbiGii toxin family protein [Kocuria sp.]